MDIDTSLMNIDFDKSIFEIVFIALLILCFSFFVSWVAEIAPNKNAGQTKKKVAASIKAYFKWLLMSAIILAPINGMLVMLFQSNTSKDGSSSIIVVALGALYVLEMALIILCRSEYKTNGEKDQHTAEKIWWGIVCSIGIMAFLLVLSFAAGSKSIENKKSLQLVEDGKYVISYYGDDICVLHKADKLDGNVTVYKNVQKIVNTENLEIKIVHDITSIAVVDGIDD